MWWHDLLGRLAAKTVRAAMGKTGSSLILEFLAGCKEAAESVGYSSFGSLSNTVSTVVDEPLIPARTAAGAFY